VSGPPDGPPLDPRRLLGALNRHHVDYLVVGGIAAQAHGASSTTYDIDCLPRDGLENAERLAGALRQLHARPFIPGIPTSTRSSSPSGSRDSSSSDRRSHAG